MKISVLGNIIDTRDIYMITPIVGNEHFKTSELQTASEYLHKKWKDLNHSGFDFEIKFFNKKTITIQIDGRDIWSDWNWFETDYLIRIKEVEEQLIELRNQIVTYWNKEKSEIPSIEFTFKKE